MSEPERDQAEAYVASGVAATANAADSSDAVGERVSAILRAAEEAAQQMRAEAQRLSDRLLQEARDSAQAKIAELTNEAEQSRREADDYARDLRMAVEAYAKKHRQDAEEGARRLTDEAEARAKTVLESAQAGAQRIEEGARRHQGALRSETQRLEERRRQALTAVRELMTVLEGLLDEAHEEPARALDETLADRRRLGRRA
jgi:cell division septum initiation protein DivIVA